MSEWQVVVADCCEVIDEYIDENTIIVTDPPFNIGYHYSGFKDRVDSGKYLDLVGGGAEQSAKCVDTLPRRCG